jgi:hypothetical protein
VQFCAVAALLCTILTVCRSAANSHAGGQQGPAYGKAVGGYETGLVGGGLVGAAAHYPSFSLKSEVDYRPSEGQDAKVQSAQRTPRARSGMNDGNAKLTGPAVDRAAYGIPARVSEASMKVPSREVPGSSTHDRSHDRFYGHAALRRTDDGGNLASNRDREVSYIDSRVRGNKKTKPCFFRCPCTVSRL